MLLQNLLGPKGMLSTYVNCGLSEPVAGGLFPGPHLLEAQPRVSGHVSGAARCFVPSLILNRHSLITFSHEYFIGWKLFRVVAGRGSRGLLKRWNLLQSDAHVEKKLVGELSRKHTTRVGPGLPRDLKTSKMEELGRSVFGAWMVCFDAEIYSLGNRAGP